MSDGNVFVFSFSQEGFEAIVNLTAIDESYVMAKMGDTKLPQSVNSILTMMELRCRYNQQRRMEIWLLKLPEDYTEEMLWELAENDPQFVADLARKGEHLSGNEDRLKTQVIE